MMNPLTRISRGKLYQELIIRLQSTTSSSSDIHIPNRIERGPTDILKALDSTVSRDYTAPHYKFHDDPYLMPLSKLQSRSLALAKESGKKAAMWIREEHCDLFQHKVAVPEIKAFVPPPIYTEESKVTEETLLNEISNGHIPNSITIYDLLNGEISIPTKQALLELLCFHNNSEPINTELLETRWFLRSQKRDKNMWITRPQIDVLFGFLKNQESAAKAAAYNALICGLAKHFHAEKAWHLYMECQENDIPLSVDGYNAIISVTPFIMEGNKTSTTVMDVYRTMAKNGILPNIHTFNAALSVAAAIKIKQAALDFARTIFADIAKFNLKPSLTTYCHALQVLSKFDDAAYNSFMKILQSLKNEGLPDFQDAKDLSFFVSAMEMASRQFCNRQAGEMINELLLTDDNYKFIGDAYKENVYYRAYLELILAVEDLETFFNLYNKLVPHVTIPEPTVMNAILKALQLHPAETVTQYIPKLWSHMIMFGHLDREGLLEEILQLITVQCKPESNSPLNAQYATMALTCWDHIQNRNAERIQHMIMSNKLVGNIIILLLRGDNFDKTIEILSRLIQSPDLIYRTLTMECINEIFELCLKQAHVPTIFTLLDYVISSNLEGAAEMARTLQKTVPLTFKQENILTTLVSNDVLQLHHSDEN